MDFSGCSDFGWDLLQPAKSRRPARNFFSHGRCFGGGVRASLGQDLINRLPPELQDRHAQVKNLRDKWVAHSVNHFDDVRVRIDATLNPDGGFEIHGVSLTAQLAGTFL